MNTNIQIKALLGAVVVMSTLSIGTNAYAGGDLGNLIKSIVPGSEVIVDPLDQINAQTKIAEQLAAQAMNSYIPGSGTAYMATVIPQGGGVIPAPQRGGGFAAPNGGGFYPVQQQLGARCATPQGVFGPGPVQPVGAFCQAMTQWGPMNGQIVQ